MANHIGEYLERLKDLYKYNFDLEEDPVIAGREFDLYAFSEIQHEQYFASRSIKIWSYNNYEHCLVKKINSAEESMLAGRDYYQELIDELVEPHRGHRQSYITLVEIREQVLSLDLIQEVEEFSLGKSFWLGIRGWCDVRLILVDLAEGRLIVNREAEDISDYYRPQKLFRT